ncbi:sensor histidine kinase [Glacieibacterium frigidum]|uniref:histidine kinase n=1 Tax=Glacieibacterium frigidum TaxID=2593303 RepID=A0A552UG93_9SPHN|nr:HAMP domain-containing sensor histidine kinase [Glacieibacterium frigidum]TRW17252.1 HAMP domain-containing histidine kinase [Glacieibacterium frigidum]
MDTGAQARAAVIAAELRGARGPTLIGVVIMTAVLIFVTLAIRPLAATPWPIDAWVAAMAMVLVGVLTLMVAGTLTDRPGRPVEPWVRGARALQSTMSALIVVSVWILLPPAGPDLRALMLMMYVWYIATVIAASSEASPMPARDIVVLTLSMVGWVVWDRPPYWEAWAVFLTMAGGTMLAFRRMIRRAVVAALEARIASETAEAATRAALATAEAARDAKTRFIASASHDLQQPLQAAALFFENAVATGDAAARARAVTGARAAFASTQGLIRQMLDHLRLEAGAVRARPEPVALGPLIAEVAAEHEPAARAAGMRLIALPCRLVATADPALLRRAVGNLIANAVRHAAGERVLIGARACGGTVTLWVIDDGRGVSAADAGRLFEDYAQGSDNATRGGFGLGLASVRRSARLMGGDADLDPRWTGGAAFRLMLPRADTVEALCEAA